MFFYEIIEDSSDNPVVITSFMVPHIFYVDATSLSPLYTYPNKKILFQTKKNSKGEIEEVYEICLTHTRTSLFNCLEFGICSAGIMICLKCKDMDQSRRLIHSLSLLPYSCFENLSNISLCSMFPYSNYCSYVFYT